MGMIGSHYWRNKRHGLNKCDESGREHCSDHVDCCAVTACTYCFELEIYGEEVQKVSSNRTDNHWTGTVGNVSFDMYWDRDYDTDECVLIVEANGEEVYRKSCYEGQSCRDSSDEAAITVDYEDAVLRWIKHESRPLPHRIDPDTGCKVWFCGECECSCRELCVTVTDPEGSTTKGELNDASYGDCEGPVWTGIVGEYELELALGWDIYDQCVLLVKVDGVEQDAVAVTGCKDLSATIELYDGTTITVACKICSCENNGPLPCCPGFPAPDTLECDVTLNAGDCSCFALVGGSYSVTLYLVNKQPNHYEYHGIRKRPSGCNAGSGASSNVYDGFVFICRNDATEGAELSILFEVSPPAEPQPSLPISSSFPYTNWSQGFPPRSVNTEDCVFPLFIFEYGDSHALDACEADLDTDVTIVVHA